MLVVNALALASGFRHVSDADALGWLRRTAVPIKTAMPDSGIEDLEPIANALKGVRIVGLGECTHGSREVFQLKHRFFEFLVKRAGFSVFALEASMPETVPMDRFVTLGEGSAEAAAKGQGFWTWSTEEVADMLKWMRRYNLAPDHPLKLRVVGIDMQNQFGAATFVQQSLANVNVKDDGLFGRISGTLPSKEDQAKLDELLERGLPEIRRVQGHEQAELTRRVAAIIPQAARNAKASIAVSLAPGVLPHFKQTLKNAAVLLEKPQGMTAEVQAALRFLIKFDTDTYTPTAEEVGKLSDWSEHLYSFGAHQQGKEKEFEAAADALDFIYFATEAGEGRQPGYRDRLMADHLQWVQQTFLPGRKIMLWAHNWHVQRSPNSMGSFLASKFGDAYFPIGSAFYEGSFQAGWPGGADIREWQVKAAPPGSLDALFQKVGPPQFFVNFDKLNVGTRRWMETPRLTRVVGAAYNPTLAPKFFQPAAVAKLYRGMIFVSKTSRSRPLQ